MKKFFKDLKDSVSGMFSCVHNVSALQISLTLLLTLSLILSNILTIKSTYLFGITWLPITIGVFAFPVTYILSDVFSEVYGYKWSRVTATYAFLGSALASLYFLFMIKMPGNESWANQEALETILGSTPRITIASLLAFWTGDFFNDNVFQWMKNKDKSGKGFAFRAIASSVVGKFIDGVIFNFIGLSFLPFNVKVMMCLTGPWVQIGFEVVLLPLTAAIKNAVRKSEAKVAAKNAELATEVSE